MPAVSECRPSRSWRCRPSMPPLPSPSAMNVASPQRCGLDWLGGLLPRQHHRCSTAHRAGCCSSAGAGSIVLDLRRADRTSRPVGTPQRTRCGLPCRLRSQPRFVVHISPRLARCWADRDRTLPHRSSRSTHSSAPRHLIVMLGSAVAVEAIDGLVAAAAGLGGRR